MMVYIHRSSVLQVADMWVCEEDTLLHLIHRGEGGRSGDVQGIHHLCKRRAAMCKGLGGHALCTLQRLSKAEIPAQVQPEGNRAA